MATVKRTAKRGKRIKGHTRTAKKGYGNTVKHPDPKHKAQGYNQPSTWPTAQGRKRTHFVKAYNRAGNKKKIKAHYRSSYYK